MVKLFVYKDIYTPIYVMKNFLVSGFKRDYAETPTANKCIRYLNEKYQVMDDIDSLMKVMNDEELFCLGYMTVMDNYFDPEKII